MSSAIAIRNQSTELSREQVELLKDTIARGATDGELGMFIQVCNRLQLDPFARQIFLVKRWDATARREVATPQVSIDGFRLVADRTGKYAGQTEPEWCGEDGKWVNVWLSKKPPSAARVGVIRTDFERPLYAVALFDEYVQRKKDGEVTHMWATKGSLMISKCAEALALRKAFPAELSGVYTTDEMGSADNDQRVEVVEASPKASAPAKSAVERTKQALQSKKQAAEQRPTLDAVLAGIEAAETLAELDRVGVLANKLGDDDKARAREAFKQRKVVLRRNADLVDQEPPHDEHGVVQEGFDYGPPAMTEEQQRSWAGDDDEPGSRG